MRGRIYHTWLAVCAEGCLLPRVESSTITISAGVAWFVEVLLIMPQNTQHQAHVSQSKRGADAAGSQPGKLRLGCLEGLRFCANMDTLRSVPSAVHLIHSEAAHRVHSLPSVHTMCE